MQIESERRQSYKLGKAECLQSLLCSNVSLLGKAQIIAHWGPSGLIGLLRLIGAVWKLLARPQGMGMGRMRHVVDWGSSSK